MAEKKTFSCPACSEEVPVGAKSCPHCGACDKSGWSEDSDLYNGLDLPEQDFDYEKFTEEEFGESPKLNAKQKFAKITAAVLLVLVIILIIFNQFFHY